MPTPAKVIAQPPWNIDDVLDYLHGWHNGCALEMDNEGQLIIYTGLTYDSDGNLVKFEAQ